jgi:hypothetical protein
LFGSIPIIMTRLADDKGFIIEGGFVYACASPAAPVAPVSRSCTSCRAW